MDPISDLTPQNDSNTGKIIIAGSALALAWAAWTMWARQGEEVPMSRAERRMAMRANPSEDLIRRIRQMIHFGLSKQEIVETIGTKQYSRDEIYLAYHAAVLADKTRSNPPRKNPKSPHVLAVPKPGYSAATSQRQVPGLFSKMKQKGFLRRNTKNIDVGGGQYTEGTDFLAKNGVQSTVFDPGWMNDSQLKAVERRINRHEFDTATVANVLNVIASPGVRSQVIMTAAAAIKPTGKAFFSTYEGDKTGIAKAPKKSQTLAANDPRRMWQENRKTETYVREIEKHFHDVTRYGDMIVASSPYKR